MTEKVSLEKNSDIREINKKLDYLIGEVTQLKSEMNNLKSSNEEKIYKLDSRLYGVCSEVITNLYKLQSTIYNYSSDCREGIRELKSKFHDEGYSVGKKLDDLQDKTIYSRFIEKLLVFSPLIAGGGVLWVVFMYKLLHG